MHFNATDMGYPCLVHQVAKLTFLDALHMAKPNGALWFRKVDLPDQMSQVQLMSLLEMMWAGAPLPARLEDL
jgi:hypothetical protein